MLSAYMADPLSFKYQPVNTSTGQVVSSFFAKKGRIDDERLTLDKRSWPIEQVHAATRRASRLILAVSANDAAPNEHEVLVLQLSSGTLRMLLPAINTRISDRRADAHRDRLAAAGRLSEFRALLCPDCGCTIDLTGHPRTPEVYCEYCDTIWTEPSTDPQRRRDEKMFRCCDQCGLYSKPTPFTSFYIIFLLVAVSYQYTQRVMCNTCMRSHAWKMMGVNMLGLIGMPGAIVQLIRAYAGGSALNKTFAGLDKANALAKARRSDAAVALYNDIVTRLGHGCGVRFNCGLTHLAANKHELAALTFAQALEDCGNYAPAANALGGCYDKLGMTAELEALKREWEDESEAAPTA